MTRQCRHLLGRESMLWTFMLDRRIPLTDNLAERAIRPYVIWRKLAFASHSIRGDRFRERVLSVVATGRQLGVPIYDYMRQICTEQLRPEGVTTLLPLSVPPPIAMVEAPPTEDMPSLTIPIALVVTLRVARISSAMSSAVSPLSPSTACRPSGSTGDSSVPPGLDRVFPLLLQPLIVVDRRRPGGASRRCPDAHSALCRW